MSRSIAAGSPGIAGLLFVASLCLSLPNLSYPAGFVFDEHIYIPGGALAIDGNLVVFDHRFATGSVASMHPPFGTSLIGLSSRVFGHRWGAPRLPSALLGALGVSLTYLVASLLGANGWWALGAGLLFLLDGARLVFSRIAMLDGILCGLTLLAAYCVLRAWEERAKRPGWWLVAFGVAAGAAMGTKWSGATIWALGTSFWWMSRARDGLAKSTKNIGLCSLEVAATLLVPAIVYLSLYGPYFLSGDTPADLLGASLEVLDSHTMRAVATPRGDLTRHPDLMPFLAWPFHLRPINLAVELHDLSQLSPRVQMVPNPFVWWSIVPATVYVLVGGWRRRDAAAIFVGACVLGQWLPWALISRPAFSYSFLPAVPFGCVCAGVFGGGMAERFGRSAKSLGVAYVVAALAFFVHFTPNYYASSPPRSWLIKAPRGRPTSWPTGDVLLVPECTPASQPQ